MAVQVREFRIIIIFDLDGVNTNAAVGIVPKECNNQTARRTNL
jgi:hypothetical protein